MTARLRGLLDEDPNYDYGTMLPFAKNKKTGEMSLAVPGIARAPAQGLLGLFDEFAASQEGEGFDPQAITEGALSLPAAGLLAGGEKPAVKAVVAAANKSKPAATLDAYMTDAQRKAIKTGQGPVGPNLLKIMWETDPARMQRAKDMGFDTDNLWYHGSPDIRKTEAMSNEHLGQNFTDQDAKEGFFFGSQPYTANTYTGGVGSGHPYDLYRDVIPGTNDPTTMSEGAGILPVLLRHENPKIENKMPNLGEDDELNLMHENIQQAKQEGYKSLVMKDIASYDGHQAVMFDPKNIRSIFAQFKDPESTNLLAANKSKTAAAINTGLLASKKFEPPQAYLDELGNLKGALSKGTLPLDDFYDAKYKLMAKHGFRESGIGGYEPLGTPEPLSIYDMPDDGMRGVDSIDEPKKDLNKIGQKLAATINASDPERMRRAKDMGFDTSQVWFHGSPRTAELTHFDPERAGALTGDNTTDTMHFASTPNASNQYTVDEHGVMSDGLEQSPGTTPVFLRMNNPMTRDAKGQYGGIEGPMLDWVDKARTKGHDSLMIKDFRDDVRQNQAVIFDPKNIRSIFAQFMDPESTDIMAAGGLPLQGLLGDPNRR